MTNEKRDRFARLYPDRVKKLIKALDVLTNCSNKSNYEFDEDLVRRTWIEIGKQFQLSAAEFDTDLTILLNGANVADIDTTEPLK
jgi:hypothetical protein